jgi:rare lipoprotein A
MLAAGCAVVPAPLRDHSAAPSTAVPRTEVGLASWYGEFHHGLPTASGEIFDMGAMTAAHRSLPLGTRLQVTNLENGRSARVRVNDRGPYVADRVLDLSRGAARALGMVARGVVPVRLELIGD